jgi:hypothetical protein
MIAVFTPTTAPVLVTSGPPELPGFNAASVWMTCSIRRPVRARSDRPSALTDDRDVGVPVLADEVGLALAAIRQCHVDAGRILDDVAVGEDEPVGGKDEPRSGTCLSRRSGGGARLSDVDADDGRGDALDGVDDGSRIGVEKLVIGSLLPGRGGESHGS